MRGTNYCAHARKMTPSDGVINCFQMGEREDTDIEVSLCCFFFYIISKRERERESGCCTFTTTVYQSIGVHVSRDGLLCVDGDSRETDRNQADVTVRKVHGADVRTARREVKARISYACGDKV